MATQRKTRGLTLGALLAASSVLLAACGGGGVTDTDAGDDGDAAPVEGTDAPAESEAEPAEDPGEFFDGETITLVVPYNPGGGFDTFVRLLAPELEAQIPGSTVVVENQPGGGGLIGANGIYNAEPDGLTLGLVNYPGAVFAEATGAEGVQFDNSDWTFLARLGAINPIVYSGEDTGLTTFEDMIAREEPVSFGIGGVGSDAYYATVVMSEVLEVPVNIVAGYPGGAEADAAVLVGEVEAGVNSVDAALGRISGTGTNILALISTEPNPAIPDVPLLSSFGDPDQQTTLEALSSIYDLERILVGPPGMEEARAQFLADAVFAAASSPEYTSAMEAAELTPSPLERAEVVSRAEAAEGSIEDLTPILQEATN